MTVPVNSPETSTCHPDPCFGSPLGEGRVADPARSDEAPGPTARVGRVQIVVGSRVAEAACGAVDAR